MTFALTLLSLCAAGLAALKVARLDTGRLAVDVPLGWFVGSGWFALASALLRFAAGIPSSRPAAAAIVLTPIVLWAATAVAARRRPGAAAVPPAAPAPSRWVPRPLWVFVPLIAYVVGVTVLTCLHGFNTPTQTDDGVRVRAFTPMLAFDDGWGAEARSLVGLAGAIPTFVPALAWRFTRDVDHFHVNYVVLADLLALLSLAVAMASARGAPERGWATAFALLSLPLFVYHCTSTYQDAVLAMWVGAGFLAFLEFARTKDPADAARALLLFAFATLVKREGGLVAVAAAAPILAQLALDRRRGRPVRWRPLALACLPAALGLVAMVAAVGAAETFPFLRLAAERGGAAGRLAGFDAPLASAWSAFLYALFNSGNAGMLYWILPAALVFRARRALQRDLAVPFAAVALIFALVAASSLWLVPAFTVNGSTDHRALLTVSIPAAMWVAALVTSADEGRARAAAGAGPALAGRRGAPRKGARRRGRR
jgi:hypothetical protein